ncbi:MAG: hypothetical protein AB7O37_23445 [Vicinamibacteria bacterium]
MGLIARAAWQALGFQVRGALASLAARRIALREAGVSAVDVAHDDESPTLRLAVHLHVAAGFNAAEVAARAQGAIGRRLPSAVVVVRAVSQ